MPTRLFHFSDDGSIECFEPRPVSVPPKRPEGREWLNGPLVWAIDDWHQPMYLFPRDCPRILVWCTKETSSSDAQKYFGNSHARIIAYVEESWLDKLESETLHRYEFPTQSFQSLSDAGMWVSKIKVEPMTNQRISNLPSRLKSSNVELRPVEVLTPVREVWNTSLHASGIRLRNARGWNE